MLSTIKIYYIALPIMKIIIYKNIEKIYFLIKIRKTRKTYFLTKTRKILEMIIN